MTAGQSTSIFVKAPPLAVFSVLSDVENRAPIIGAVSRIVLRSPPPVAAGTVFREWRSAPLSLWGVRLEIRDFMPPTRLTMLRRCAGLSLGAVFTVVPEGDGSRLALTVDGAFRPWPFPPMTWLARALADRWKRQLTGDLAAIGRHAAQRADPAWRPGIGRSSETDGPGIH